MNDIELAVVMPIYNEEGTIEGVLKEWMEEFNREGISFTIICVDDGSKDNTWAILGNLADKYPGCLTPVHKENNGHGRACRTGYALAAKSKAPWTLQIDSDGQCDPRFFSSFWKVRNSYDVIYGLRKTRDDGFIRVLISFFCTVAVSFLSGVALKDSNVPYRLIKTSVLDEAFSRIPEEFDMQNLALTLALKRNKALSWNYIPIHFRDRQGGTNSINVKRILQMGWTLLSSLHQIRR